MMTRIANTRREIIALANKVVLPDRVNLTTFVWGFGASLVVGVLAFWPPGGLSLLLGLTVGLLTLTGATFAIIGVWLTLLNPLAVFDTGKEQDAGKKALVKKLRPFFKLSILTFGSSVILRLLVAMIPAITQNLGMWLGMLASTLEISYQLPSFAVGLTYSIARVLSGGLVIYLFFVQILIILVNLIPLFDSGRAEEKEEWQKGIEARKGETISH